MTKRQVLDDPDSCLNKAHDDEPVFVLRGRDALASQTVLDWIVRARTAGVSQAKIEGALEVVHAILQWSQKRIPD